MDDISPKTILLVDDDSYVAKVMSIVLRKNGFETIIADSGEKAIEIINSGEPVHLILMDIVLGEGMDGVQTAQIILKKYDIPLIFISGYTDPEVVRKTETIGSYGYILKNSGETILIASIKMAFNLYEARRKIAEHEIAYRRREWFENIILASVSDGVVVTDERGIMLYANQMLGNIFGYSSEELTGSKLIMLMPEYLRDKHIAAFRSYIATGEKHLPCWTSVSLPGLHKLGHEISLEVSWTENTSHGQRVFCGLMKDVTERVKAERTIKQQNEFLRTVIDSLEHPFYVVNADTHIIEIANKATHPNLPENSRCYDLIHHFDAPCRESGHSCILEEIKITHKPANIEHVHYHRNGEAFHTEVRGYPIFDENGRVARIIEYCVDITQRKQTELALRELTDELERRVEERTAEVRDLYDHAPCGYHSLNADGLIVAINDTELSWLGYERKEIVGKRKITDLFPPKSVEMFRHNFPMFKQKGVVKGLEFEMIRKNGSVMPVLLSATAIYDSEGSYLMSRSTLFDITDRKKAEEELARKSEEITIANAALEKSARLKDEFLASMSHELRTPLNTVLNLSESLRDEIYGTLNERQFKAVSSIERSGQHLLELISDILDLSKIEAGHMELEIEKSSVNDICQSALQLVRGMANRKRQNILFAMNSVSSSLKADARRIRQILVNLLSNAVKFTPEDGHIGLEVSGDPSEQVIRFVVWDTGIGIPAKDFDKLFQPFVQLDSSLSRKYAGTGLGLSLVRRMAELHGGGVMLESEPGKGSRFTVSLPWISDDTVCEAETPSYCDFVSRSTSASLSSILLVEDNEANIETYSDFLKAKGYRVGVARNGTEGIRKARELKPSLILMDIQMPGMDGLEATRRIRADADPEVAEIPIIALTALVMPGDKELCLAAGADHYLAKPVSLRLLSKTIEELCPESKRTTIPATPSDPVC